MDNVGQRLETGTSGINIDFQCSNGEARGRNLDVVNARRQGIHLGATVAFAYVRTII